MEIPGQVFRRGVQLGEGRDVVEKLVIELADGGVNRVLEVFEIAEQPDGVEFRALQRHADLVIMPVNILTLAAVAAQRMARRETFFHPDLKHWQTLQERKADSSRSLS